jgi:hypothetical protein
MEGGRFKATIYRIERYYPGFGQAMLLLSGARMFQIFGPNYAFFGGDRGPAYSPRMHLRKVRLAAVHAAPPAMPLEAATIFLRSFT